VEWKRTVEELRRWTIGSSNHIGEAPDRWSRYVHGTRRFLFQELMTSGQKPWGINLDDNADALEQLVHEVYQEIACRPVELADLKQAMVALPSYLASPEGRTDHNCRAVDRFFCIRDDWDIDEGHLPTSLQRILEDMGGALHATVRRRTWNGGGWAGRE